MSKDDLKRYLILKDPNILKGLIILAIPIMFNNLLRTIHDIVDMYFVSKIASFGEASMTSISVTFPVVFTFISLGIGLSIAGTALISQYVGASQGELAKKYATNLVIISLLIGIILNVVAFVGAPIIMRIMGADGYIYDNSVLYLRIRSFELPALFVFFGYQAIRNASGDTVSPVIIGASTIIVNVVLSPILIAMLNMGVAGAAYATLISHVIVLPFVLYYLHFEI